MVGIKDFGMPSCCMNCNMYIDDGEHDEYCCITATNCKDSSEKNGDCPLVEINESNAVSREEAKKALVQYLRGKKSICECIDDCPSVQPKREKGEWIEKDKEMHKYFCSKCSCGEDLKTNFCSNCGADMRGEK